jgi:demethylmenaquinone methyltransferase / 2-methoxy-6-polyprenyl-1,4-benzoquinol methylase
LQAGKTAKKFPRPTLSRQEQSGGAIAYFLLNGKLPPQARRAHHRLGGPCRMSNKFYQPGEQRAARVGDLFAAIAPRYDLINDLQSLGLHRRWKRALLAMAGIKPGERALDLCCGTGDISFALQAAGADVVGIDFSPAMLAVAQERAKNIRAGAATARLQFLCADALEIPFDDGSFDVVTVGYGLRNLASWERGLEEMARVARPGGRLLALDFGRPENKAWRFIYFAGLKFFVPLFGKVFCKDAAAYAYIFESLRDYPAQRGVAAKMETLQCRDIQVRHLLGGAMSIHFGRTKKDC